MQFCLEETRKNAAHFAWSNHMEHSLVTGPPGGFSLKDFKAASRQGWREQWEVIWGRTNQDTTIWLTCATSQWKPC